MTIGIIGVGYVGATLANYLVDEHCILCYEIDKEKIKRYTTGEEVIFEPNLKLYEHIKSKLIEFVELEELLKLSHTVFVCVGTPSDEQGNVNLSYVFDVAKNINKFLYEHNVESYFRELKRIIIRSTVPPTTTRQFEEIVNNGIKSKVDVYFMPEFLRQGSAVEDTAHPDRMIIGSISLDIFERPYEFNRIIDIFGFQSCNWVTLSVEEAEMVKYASNFMLASKLSSANQIANMCERIEGMDAVNVMKAVGMDKRIGDRFMNIGIGYGGSCLPKDVIGISKYMENTTDVKLLNVIHEFNDTQKYRVINMLEEATNSRLIIPPKTTINNIINNSDKEITVTDLFGKFIAILGLAFKENTNDTRYSPARNIIRYILAHNGNVKVFDPKADISTLFTQEELERFGSRLIVEPLTKFALLGADAVIIVTPWEEFKKLTPEDFLVLMKTPIVIDGRRIYDPKTLEKAGVNYYAIGYGRNRKEIPETN